MLRIRAPASVEGRLRIFLESGRTGTRVGDLESAGPLRIIRPFPLSEGWVLLQILTVGPGVLGGDRFRIEIHVGRGAKAVVVQQSATKVHRMPQGLRATQHVRLILEEDAELEYYPGLTIPYPEAEYHQRTEASLSSGSRFGFVEIWAMGRDLRKEHLAFRRIVADLGVYAEGTPVYREALHLDPTADPLDGTGLLEGARYAGSGFWRWGPAEPEFWEGDGMVLAAGRTGFGDLYLKALARDGLSLRKRIEALLASWRARWGLPPIGWGRYGSGWG